MKLALLCPGQGAQAVGMGVAWTTRSARAQDVFARASEVLGFDLLKVCAEGPAGELTRTDVCQPAILTTSAACLAALEEEGRIDLGQVQVALGLSLGEYTALHAAGVLGLEDAVPDVDGAVVVAIVVHPGGPVQELLEVLKVCLVRIQPELDPIQG